MSQSLSVPPAERAGASPLSARRVVYGVLLAWAGLALAVAASGVLEDPPPFVPPLLIWSGPLAFLVAWRRSPGFRQALRAVDSRAAVLFHLVRMVAGAGFLWLYAQGRLSGAFALFAGWGDLAVGLAALPVALGLLPARTPAQRWGVLAWSALGLVDIVSVVANGNRLVFLAGDTTVLRELTRFPFSLLPLYVVPLVLMTHFLVLARLWRPGRAQEAM